MNSNEALFFKDKPLFGLDIGSDSLKVLQVSPDTKQRKVIGYGAIPFDSSAFENGIITKPELIAQAAHELFSKRLIGDITSNRVVLSVPASKTFNRNFHLPKLSEKELTDAIKLEVDQYVPTSAEELYIDHTKLRDTEEESEYLMVAAPKRIIDSYIQLTQILGLEVVGVETTIDAGARLFVESENGDVPTVLIDFGSSSADLTIYDNGQIVTGTAAGGGEDFTNLIASTLGVTKQEAHVIKTKYGLGLSKKQKEITQGLAPVLQQIVKEVKRMVRYYEERSGSERKLTQVVTMGGGANMPGLSEYLTNTLRIPCRTFDPWQSLHFDRLQPPNNAEKSMYSTVAGLALTSPKELFK